MPVAFITSAANMLTGQLNHEAASITFSGNQPLATDEVVEAV